MELEPLQQRGQGREEEDARDDEFSSCGLRAGEKSVGAERDDGKMNSEEQKWEKVCMWGNEGWIVVTSVRFFPVLDLICVFLVGCQITRTMSLIAPVAVCAIFSYFF